MKLSAFLAATLSVGLALLAVPARAEKIEGAERGGRPFLIPLTGAAEMPEPGDPDGSGTAELTLNLGQGLVCFAFTVEEIAPVTVAHIHKGTADVAGPVVVDFAVPTHGLQGCVSVDKELIKEITKDLAGYYVNVHNAAFPAGALRGQMAKK